ncbi:hypothetical protein ACS0TY_021438 [Phlomoides rotata]
MWVVHDLDLGCSRPRGESETKGADLRFCLEVLSQTNSQEGALNAITYCLNLWACCFEGVEGEFYPAFDTNELDQDNDEEVPYDMDAELEALLNATPSNSGSSG